MIFKVNFQCQRSAYFIDLIAQRVQGRSIISSIIPQLDDQFFVQIEKPEIVLPVLQIKTKTISCLQILQKRVNQHCFALEILKKI